MTNLLELDLSMWDTSKLTNITGFITSDANLINLNLSNWDLSNVTSYSIWFYGASNLDIVDMSNVIFPENSGYLLGGGPGFTAKKLILKNVDTSKVTNMNSMFSNETNIQELDLSSFDTSHVTDMSNLFQSTTNLQKLNLSNWDLSKIETGSILNGLSNLNTLDMTNFVFPSNSNSFFAGLSGLNNLILSDVDTSKVTNMAGMFQSASNLQELDLSSFDTSQVTSMSVMFAGTTNLQSITFGPKFVHNQEAFTSAMFSGCPSQDRPTGDTWSGVSFD